MPPNVILCKFCQQVVTPNHELQSGQYYWIRKNHTKAWDVAFAYGYTDAVQGTRMWLKSIHHSLMLVNDMNLDDWEILPLERRM